MPLISIIMVTLNSMGFIKEALESISGQTDKNFELIIVDNGSSDGTVEFIKKKYSRLTLIENRENKGFCRANNQAISIAKGKYILTLNSDVILDENFIKEIKRLVIDSNDTVGMVGAKILKLDRRTVDSTGLSLSKYKRFYDRGMGEIDNGQFDEKSKIFGPCAAAALYKREMLDDIEFNGEYFDSDFFFLVEDFDIAWRARLCGWNAVFSPKSLCYHLRSSSDYDTKFKQYLSFRNRYFLIIKNEVIKSIVKDIPCLIAYDLPRLFYLLITNRHTLRALYEMVKFTPAMLKKRSFIMSNRRSR